jgi:hypothetical protein
VESHLVHELMGNRTTSLARRAGRDRGRLEHLLSIRRVRLPTAEHGEILTLAHERGPLEQAAQPLGRTCTQRLQNLIAILCFDSTCVMRCRRSGDHRRSGKLPPSGDAIP